MRRLWVLAGLLAGSAGGPALAQNQGDVATMSCADYLKAEQASGFSEGVTGKPGMDRLPPEQAARVHDFCVAHPDSNARAAIQQVQAK